MEGHSALRRRVRGAVARLQVAARQPADHGRGLRPGAEPDRRAARRPGGVHGQVPRVGHALLRLAHGPGRPELPGAHAGRADAGRADRAPGGPEGRGLRGLRLAGQAPHPPLSRPGAVRGHRDVLDVLPALHPAPSRGQPRAGHPAGRDRRLHRVHRALARGPRRAAQRRRPAGAVRRPSSRRSSPACAPSRTSRSCASARACRWCARSASPPSWWRCCASTTRST